MSPQELFINHSKQCIYKKCLSFSKADAALPECRVWKCFFKTLLQSQHSCSEITGDPPCETLAVERGVMPGCLTGHPTLTAAGKHGLAALEAPPTAMGPGSSLAKLCWTVAWLLSITSRVGNRGAPARPLPMGPQLLLLGPLMVHGQQCGNLP